MKFGGVYEYRTPAWTGRDVVELCGSLGGCCVIGSTLVTLYVPSETRDEVVRLCHNNMPVIADWRVVGFRPRPIDAIEFNRG